MADFVIIVAALTALASMDPALPIPAVPDSAPTLGFKTYPDLEACETAVTRNVARPGTRLVCVPTGGAIIGNSAHQIGETLHFRPIAYIFAKLIGLITTEQLEWLNQLRGDNRQAVGHG